ncbi:T9SS type B sorting domain-containing protein [Flavobacterium sp. XGLA_31]|uniref:T9SS type B sorting domain-containing protein n=1 Tax=Flavobacterium sp. XGLA_31 TaxID=3447666 RepID=UPI003F2CB44E
MKKLITLLFILLAFTTSAQFSKTHYIPPLSNSDLQEPQEQTMYISCPSITPVNFQIQEIGGGIITGTVDRDNPYVYSIGWGFDTQLLVSSSDVSTVKNNKGFIVQAEDLVYVTVRLTSTPQNYQAGGLVSKGSAALGTQFRIGAFTNTGISAITENHYTFASILATENNTIVSFSDIKPGVTILNNTLAGNTPDNITLNAGESYVIAVEGPNNANRDGLIGAAITSDKPIAVNCGSFAGTNGNNNMNLDLGFDQIVSAERTGTEYIFIKGSGVDVTERPLLVANEDNTDIFLNGSTIPTATLNSGEYLALSGADFSPSGNLYVNASKNIFAYQGIGGTTSQANQNMHFVPPLSCQTPKTINNIPYINQVGGLTNFDGTVCIVTKTGATLNFIIDGIAYTLATLPPGITSEGPLAVTGNSNYVTYSFTGLTGNVSVFSTEQLYLSYYGSSGAATYGGFYSGFTFNPEIIFKPVASSASDCIPNINLEINAISSFDIFQWYFNGNPIPGATASTYNPTQPGYYQVIATLSACGTTFPSDIIPVSSCAIDDDHDGINNNIDLDIDNDGLTNCTESYGDQNFNLTNTSIGAINVGNYIDTYIGTIAFSGTGIPSTTPLVGDANGNFITEASAGKNNAVKYNNAFNNPISLAIEYAATALSTDLFTSNTEIRISCPVTKTLTILNPDNQLLIDTNYDGYFESGVTQYSSFEIRFRLNSTVPLAAGTGTFSIRADMITSLTVTNINLIDDTTSRVALKLIATCVPKDSDNDLVYDAYDLDSDNDSIPDFFENQGQNVAALSHVDVNGDGIDDLFGMGIIPADTDGDGYPNYLDLDSDNDGIFDTIESGSPGNSTNTSGVPGNLVGSNGLENTVETPVESGIINYTITDTDGDGIFNYIEADSDDDGCYDTIEAGFDDLNNDGIVGDAIPPNIMGYGLVISSNSYGVPNSNYTIAAPITITTQPQDFIACELQPATFTIVTGTPITSYQWQVSTNGGTTWTNLTNSLIYSGVTTNSMTITSVAPSMTGNQYRVFLNRSGNTCGLYSAAAVLTTYALPVVTTPITLKQCDDDTDGISTFNLTQKNDVISANYANETFTYYTTLVGSQTGNNAFLIPNPYAYTAGNSSIYARVVNANGCPNFARINLIVSVTQIPASFNIPNLSLCDDYLDAANDDRDGISGPFDFTGITNSLLAVLPTPASNYNIKYYKTEADFLAETDTSGNSLAIPNTTNYRNIGFPGSQTIWVRVESSLDNSCYGFKTFSVNVEALPYANPVNANNLIRHCDDNQDGLYAFDTTGIEATILNGQTGVHLSYTRANGTQTATLPNPLVVNGSETLTIRVINNSGKQCYDDETLQFIVDDLPQAFTIPTNLTTQCDDEVNSLYQDGVFDFDTGNFEASILGTQTGMTVYYFDENNNPLPSPLPNPFKTGTQNIRVVVENPINTSCSASMIIPLIVHPRPKIDQEDTELICVPSTQVVLDAAIIDGSPASNYTYQWYYNGTILPGHTAYTFTATTPGTYGVWVTNSYGCTTYRSIKVIASEIASIQNLSVSDFSDSNSVRIFVNGTGDYEFALDDIAGPYRDNGYFNNVPIGLHELYVRDKNGCGILGPIAVAVMGIPHYFTPNNDGFHDDWNVQGISPTSANAHSVIYIFDRYGKLLKQIQPNGPGWDGTYNGYEMPADDYWFDVHFVDGRKVKGHFALKR